MNRIFATDHTVTPGGPMQGQLDRLAGGDLPESERQAVLAWLDEEPARWRACGMAFLEAQMWQESAATAALQAPAPIASPQPAARAPEGKRRQRWHVSLLALSAAVAVAFLAGALAARWLPLGSGQAGPMLVEQPGPGPSADQPQLATVAVNNPNSNLPLMLQLPVTTGDESQQVAGASPISDYERRMWERRGFEVIEELRYLPARLPDGRVVMVPVNKVQLKFKGTPVS
jgi:hypothetical protein